MSAQADHASKKIVVVDAIEQSDSLFYAYLKMGTEKTVLGIFANAATCQEWWQGVQKLVGVNEYSQVKDHWYRLGPQLFYCDDSSHHLSPQYFVANTEEMQSFVPKAIFQALSNSIFPVIPPQRTDGFLVGQKYTHAVPAALPKMGDEIDDNYERQLAFDEFNDLSREQIPYILPSEKVEGEVKPLADPLQPKET